MVPDATEIWDTCSQILRTQITEAVWMTSFQDTTATELLDGELVLEVPSTLVKERIESRYLALIQGALTDMGTPDIDIRIEVAPAPDPGPFVFEESLADRRPLGLSPSQGTTHHTRAVDQVNPLYTFEAFVIGASNRFAHAAALSVAETPGRSYNPLFIYGAAGLGKTHLLQAIAHYVADNYPSFTIRYVSTETFMNEYVDALRQHTMPEFKRRFRDIDLLLLDDVQFIEGKEGLQEELFHTFNALSQTNRQIVLSSDRPPDSIDTLEDRLRSRFKAGLLTDIQPPDLETRFAILRQKAESEKRWAPDEVLELIATHVTNNIRELEGALIRISAYSSLNDEPLTIDLAEKVLGDLLTASGPEPITPERILQATSDMFGFPVEELTGKSRRRPLVEARQISMYVFREITDLSYPAIARHFGGRDHTTVIHAVDKITALMKERRKIYDQVSALTQAIKSGS
jgi:chromosomal replication initiator protein